MLMKENDPDNWSYTWGQERLISGWLGSKPAAVMTAITSAISTVTEGPQVCDNSHSKRKPKIRNA